MNNQIDTSRQDKNSHRLSIKQTCTYGMFTEEIVDKIILINSADRK